MSLRSPRRPLALASFVSPALLLALLPGCRDGASDPPSPAAHPARLSAGTPRIADPAALEAAFPGHSAAVVHAGASFSPTSTGFSARAGGISVELPARAADGLVLRAAGGAPISVYERDVAGDAQPVDRAVAYARAGGSSYWTAAPGGAEEWIRLDAGAVRPGAPSAVWEIAGATLMQRGAAIDVVGDGGGRLRVTAPAAFAAGGAPVAVRLAARGTTIELFVEASGAHGANGRAVLVDPMWMTVAPMPGPLEIQAGVALADGRVLMAGGDDGQEAALATVYLYDPMANTWTIEPDMTNPREGQTATLLQTGQVLMAGGEDGYPNVLQDADSFDPTTETWTNSTMTYPHTWQTATLLTDGRVLIAGGQGPTSGNLTTIDNCDLYDPTLGVGGTWTTAAPMNQDRAFHAAARLTDGTVLVSGGYTNDSDSDLDSSEIYDPVGDTWTTTGSMNDTREDHTAALLPDGKVLVAGGDGPFGEGFANLSSAELYDPATQLWSYTGQLSGPRSYHSMTAIPGGLFMVIGGDDGTQSLATTEIYDPAAGTWSMGPTLNEARESFAIGVAANQVTVAGGYDSTLASKIPVTASAEVVVFGQPNGTACMTGPPCASGFCVDDLCCDTACLGACTACTAAKKGSGADGTCGPVAKGTDPGGSCMDQGPATCGTDGSCDGNGACEAYADGTVCETPTPCVVAVCAGGTCGGRHQLDGSPCPGGVCIAGGCVPDVTLPDGGPTATSSSSSGTTTTSTTTTGAGGAATSTSSSGGGGEGGQAGGSVTGGGCHVVEGGGEGPRGAAAALLMGLLGLVGRRRRGQQR